MSLKRSVLGQCVRLLCMLAFFISGMSIAGYATGVEFLRRWSITGPEMALNTAVCIVLLSVAVFIGSLANGNGPFKEVV